MARLLGDFVTTLNDDKSAFIWSLAAGTMQQRQLTPEEAMLFQKVDEAHNKRKRFGIFIAGLPGIILALQQLLEVVIHGQA
jgi:hypothetical protein